MRKAFCSLCSNCSKKHVRKQIRKYFFCGLPMMKKVKDLNVGLDDQGRLEDRGWEDRGLGGDREGEGLQGVRDSYMDRERGEIRQRISWRKTLPNYYTFPASYSLFAAHSRGRIEVFPKF
ncbi:hypothetical protein L211DRAFT_834863 [Terfezia boudieri ATCC MYA-4762]|uniref:Uncharacterized protein n=1 Tax=Terfezia boudieri ATCC MYA-4762 TaxID=1051890 RepID=A0A3N4M1D4_9PEZI|nr:hypothetical protein L211DRAFT_834863 [Terfezia boudieri ATCC MYA-4762]